MGTDFPRKFQSSLILNHKSTAKTFFAVLKIETNGRE